MDYDVIVIGAGIHGLSAAMHLALQGKKTALLEQKEFIAAGGHLLDGCPVTSVNVLSDSLVRVSGPRGQLSSVALVICAGAWSKRLLDPLGISLPLRVVKTATFYWKKREHNIPSTSFIDVSHTSNYYGLPSYEYPGLVKVCLHDGIQVDPDSRDAVSSEALRDKVSRYVSTYFPCLVPQPAIEESCMYTKTPDNEMIIDTLPKYNNVAFACGFSGSGFKIAPAVGQILSRLVTNQPPGHDITPFRSSRFKMADSKL